MRCGKKLICHNASHLHPSIDNINHFYILDSWISFFDLVIVDACKPRFFSSGTPLQYVDTSTSTLFPVSSTSIPPQGPLVYSGGDHTTITAMLKATGSDVIYVGDHL